MSAVGNIDSPWLRPMQESDLEAIMVIERAAYPYPWTAGIFRDCLSTGYNCWTLVTTQSEPLALSGYGIMSIMAGECHILNLCIAPQLQNRGLGRLLLTHLLDLARDYRASLTLLEVRPSNTAAIALYEKAGFTEVGMRKHYYPAKNGHEDGLILALDMQSDSVC